MRLRALALVAAALALPSTASPRQAGRLPGRADELATTQESRLAAIKETFQTSWSGYRHFAWGHDSLRPITNTYYDDRNGWGASAVDALSTAILMEEADVVKEIVTFIQTIDWTQTQMDVSLFETTIRYLGGLLSGYDLLSGPYQHLAPSDSLVDGLLAQATDLADLLKVAFNTPSGLPDNTLVFQPYPHIKGEMLNGLATVGTLILEWQRLSDLTGDPEYANLASKAEEYLLKPNPQESEPFPGMVGSQLYVENGTFYDSTGSWSGGTDSFYEYLIKMYVYDAERYGFYKDRWVDAVESSMKYLVSHPTTRPDLTFLAMYSGPTPYFYSGHLACFNGGNFILGGLVLEEQRYVDFGLELTNACHETYIQTGTGLGPEIIQWQDNNTSPDAWNNIGPPGDQVDFYEKAGFWILNGQYVLRPEVIESFYYAYRATGDEMYRDWAWDAFQAIIKTCSVGSGLSSIANVNPENGTIEYYDFQESFWFAEVMKYSYIIQMDGNDDWHVSGSNKFVFNTEAHILAVFDASRDNRKTEETESDADSYEQDTPTSEEPEKPEKLGESDEVDEASVNADKAGGTEKDVV